MDAMRFDRLTRAVSMRLPRRTLASALGLGALALPSPADAKKKRKKKKVTFNDFGCVNVGSFCKNGGQCCSGICQGKKRKQGKKDKRTCVAHNVLDCPAEADACQSGGEVPCGTQPGPGACYQTTGQASFCAAGGDCVACTKDADCEPEFGPGAACAVCISCPQTGNTVCLPPAG